jgi:hypothetical protein
MVQVLKGFKTLQAQQRHLQYAEHNSAGDGVRDTRKIIVVVKLITKTITFSNETVDTSAFFNK